MTALLGLWFFGCNAAYATTWYVRDGGGSVYGTTAGTNVCNGQVNAAYSSGVSPNCALSHPALVMGAGDSGSGSGTTVLWTSGDTLYIDGDSDIAPGTQAQYMIGYGMPNSSGCSTGDEYNCWLLNVPAGISSSQPTQIIGTGTHKPQLWGATATYQMLTVKNNYINLQWLEITDHYACATNDPTGGCSGTLAYATYGIVLSGTGINLTDVYVHGIGQYGIITRDINGSMTFTRVWSIGNGFSGMNVGADGNTPVTGTMTFNQPIVEWNGCVEAYPMAPGIDNPANYSNCFGQQSGGYGDGLAFGPNGSLDPGSWILIGPGSISFNTQDGLDIYHGTAGVGNVSIDKMRFEGNAGQQIKVGALNFSLSNSTVIGDCGWWFGAAQSLSGGMPPGDSCRSDGDSVFFNVTNASTANIYNYTIIANGLTDLETQDGSGAGCNGATQVNVYNNIILGGYDWVNNSTIRGTSKSDALVQYYYNTGNDGNGGGTCGNISFNEDYNLLSTLRYPTQCAGAHDKCGVNPNFTTGAFPLGAYQGGQNT